MRTFIFWVLTEFASVKLGKFKFFAQLETVHSWKIGKFKNDFLKILQCLIKIGETKRIIQGQH